MYISKPNWVNTSPNSGNGNGSIQVTAQANEGDARQGSVAVAGGGDGGTEARDDWGISHGDNRGGCSPARCDG